MVIRNNMMPASQTSSQKQEHLGPIAQTKTTSTTSTDGDGPADVFVQGKGPLKLAPRPSQDVETPPSFYDSLLLPVDEDHAPAAFDAKKIAGELHDATKWPGTDEEAVYDALTDPTKAEASGYRGYTTEQMGQIDEELAKVSSYKSVAQLVEEEMDFPDEKLRALDLDPREPIEKFQGLRSRDPLRWKILNELSDDELKKAADAYPGGRFELLACAQWDAKFDGNRERERVVAARLAKLK